ncbi:MAG: hypothetical protein JNM82_03590 [Rhodocyclaceae bacterium]|nr:hypothetical protein [Rhodocyclaceae bacterium]
MPGLRAAIAGLPGGRLLKRAFFGARAAAQRVLPWRLLHPNHLPVAPVFWIDPFLIERHTRFVRPGTDDWEDWVFDQRGPVAQVQDGDWDLGGHKVEEMRICRAVEARVQRAEPWEATDYYRMIMIQMQAGRVLWGCRTEDDLRRRCAYLDDLIESMRRHGYRLNHEVVLSGEDRVVKSFRDRGNEITVNVGRNGEFLFQDGRHRLATARALGIGAVPVRVLVRHAGWKPPAASS